MNLKNKQHNTSEAANRPSAGKLAYTTKELAALLGVSTRSLRRLEQRGLLKPSRALRKKLYSAAAVAAFFEATS